jgi:hypothetical protein
LEVGSLAWLLLWKLMEKARPSLSSRKSKGVYQICALFSLTHAHALVLG